MTTTAPYAPTYGSDDSTPPGATDNEQFSVEIGDSGTYIRAGSQEELDNFLAWLSLVSGKPIDELTVPDLIRFVPMTNVGSYDWVDDPDGGRSKVFSLESDQWKSVQEFNDTEYFGDNIPLYPPGTGKFFGYAMPKDKGVETSGWLYGMAGTANTIYSANYPAGAELPAVDESTVPPDVLNLHKKMFGDVPMTQGHLNTLKMMNLVSGDAGADPSTWTTTERGAEMSAEWEKPQTTFVPANTLLEWELPDWTKAVNFAQFFDESGNLKEGTGPELLEDQARELRKSMGPTETPLPPGMTVDPETQAMLNHLFGLPANNTKFTAEQINVGVATGLVQIDPNTNTVTLTANGKGYLAARTAAGTSAEGTDGTTTTTEPGIWDYYNNLTVDRAGDDKREADGEGDGWQMADYLESQVADRNGNKGDGDNGNVGTNGMELLANLTTDSAYWEDAGLGHLTTEERQGLIDSAKKITEHPEYESTWNEMSQGNRVEGAVHKDDLKDWLSTNSHKGLPDDKRAAEMYKDSGVITPEGAPTNSVSPDELTTEDRTDLNRITNKLFGKQYDSMTEEEQQKALWVLTTLGYITATSTTESDDNVGTRVGPSSGSSESSTDITLTEKATTLLNPPA